MLPQMKVLKNFKRIEDENASVYNIANWIKLDIENKKAKRKWNNAQSNMLSLSNLYWSTELFKDKIDISKEMYIDSNGEYKLETDYYKSNWNKDLTENELISYLKSTYPRIMWCDVNLTDFTTNDNSYTINVNANEDSFYYKGSVKLTINKKTYYSASNNVIDLTTNTLNLNSTSTNWANDAVKFISENVKDIGTTIWNTLNITGGISHDDYNNYNIWLYDNVYNVDRYSDWMLLKTDSVYKTDTKADYNYVSNNSYSWPSNLSRIYNNGKNTVYFGVKKRINDTILDSSGNIEKQSTFLSVGKESWQNIDLLIFKIKINLS